MIKAKDLAEIMGIQFSKFPLSEFEMGLEAEMEHEDVTGGDPILTAKIALAHLKEFPDYYTRLEAMEKQAKKDWA